MNEGNKRGKNAREVRRNSPEYFKNENVSFLKYK